MKTKIFFQLILALILALISWEFALRETLWRQPRYQIFPKGIVALPGGTSVRSQEGFSKRRHVNEFGTFHEIRKDLPLVVFQGDSYTYAEQVATEENYSSLVRKRFQNQLEILNAGNFGMSVAHYAYNFRYFEKLNPVYHVIQVKFDDFFDSFETSDPLHFVLKDGQLEFEIHRTGFMKWVESNPQIYNSLNQLSILSYFRDKYLQEFNAWIKQIGQKRKPSATSESKYDPKIDLMKERAEKIKVQMIYLKSIYGEKFSLLYLPRNPVMKNKNLFVVEENEMAFNSLILKICAEQKIHCISMWQPFSDLYSKEKILSSGFSNTTPGEGHINKYGHQLIADELVPLIEERVLK